MKVNWSLQHLHHRGRCSLAPKINYYTLKTDAVAGQQKMTLFEIPS